MSEQEQKFESWAIIDLFGHQLNDDISLSDEACPRCRNFTYTRVCDNCDDGMSGHDCGDDCCACFMPEDNVTCDWCDGRGWHHWCPRCGWDLLEKHYINGCDERYRQPQDQST